MASQDEDQDNSRMASQDKDRGRTH